MMNPTDREDTARDAVTALLGAEAAKEVLDSPALGALATNLDKAAAGEGSTMSEVLGDTLNRCREEWAVDGNDFEDWLAHRANTPAAFLASRVGDR